MEKQIHNYLLCFGLACLLGAAHISVSFAAVDLPNAADINRMQSPSITSQPQITTKPIAIPEANTIFKASQPPENADAIHLLLNKINVQGVDVYQKEKIESIYAPYLNKNITLSQVWEIADKITSQYRKDGYFLSRAYIPAQEIDQGVVNINVTEGYIIDVVIEQSLFKHPAVEKIVKRIKKQRPADIKDIESLLLHLTDVPGLENYHSVLTPYKNIDGAVQLILEEQKQGKESKGYVSINNYGSRYLGPHQIVAHYSDELIPFQRTELDITTSIPTKEVGSLNIAQTIPVTPALSLQATMGYTTATPGYTLRPQDIESEAINAGLAINYKIIRQRLENLTVGVALDGRNSKSTILGSDLSDDKIRVLRVTSSFDKVDMLGGYSLGAVSVSRGLSFLGASDEGDLNSSRAGAYPDFTKLNVDLSRLQSLSDHWNALLSVSGQLSSGSMYSSEEFGYGGQNFGRAYSPSEISGDDGIAASAEIRYTNIPEWKNITVSPYGFYDFGKVWNDNASQDRTVSASSAGVGVRLHHQSGIDGNFQFAVPLTRSVDVPLYGASDDGPQMTFQVTKHF